MELEINCDKILSIDAVSNNEYYNSGRVKEKKATIMIKLETNNLPLIFRQMCNNGFECTLNAKQGFKEFCADFFEPMLKTLNGRVENDFIDELIEKLESCKYKNNN